MKKLYLNLWWHMHQPLYKNPITGLYELPWVLLHSLKDYLEMPLYIEGYRRIKANFNITPVLIDQIEEYAEGIAGCKLLGVISKDPETLNEEEKIYLLDLYKLLTEPLKSRFPQLKELFPPKNIQDFIDLQVLYILSWMGDLTVRGRESINRLISKGRFYTHKDKEELLKEIPMILRDIFNLYRELQKEKRITITTSPYYHPILPLLFDMECAKESSPGINLPSLRANFVDDAIVHIKRAIGRYERLFGKKPFAFWPSEGSLSNRTLDELNKCGIRLVATDEAVLYNSGYEGSIHRVFPYKDKIVILFRNRDLSDRIGFVYQHWSAESAVEDFIGRLRYIYDGEDNPVVSVILDGENCWEYYPENGRRFLQLLYDALEQEGWIETVTLEEILNLCNCRVPLEYIKAGSWINGNFLKWIGSGAKNEFWDYLARAKMDIGKSDYLLVAEGSDWFWWQGEEGNVPFLDIFERIFFYNLKRAYLDENIDIPKFIQERGI